MDRGCNESFQKRAWGRRGSVPATVVKHDGYSGSWRERFGGGLNKVPMRASLESRGVVDVLFCAKIRPTQAHIEGFMSSWLRPTTWPLEARSLRITEGAFVLSIIMATERPRRSTRVPAKYQDKQIQDTHATPHSASKKRKASPIKDSHQDPSSLNFLLTNPKSPLVNMDLSVSYIWNSIPLFRINCLS